MKCAWDAYLRLIPVWMRQSVDRQGRETLQELRLRLNSPPVLITAEGRQELGRQVTLEDIQFSINMASKYSPWTAQSIASGYITAAGGHRMGICGAAVRDRNMMTGIRSPTSLCIRVARDFHGIAREATGLLESILIIGKPGSGKTTLLRDLIRTKSHHHCVAVVDEREEIFPRVHHELFFDAGKNTDILSSCGKNWGIEAVLRSMTPDIIAVDEITAIEDCDALIHAGWCGVKLLATAHATSTKDLISRPVYRPIVDSGLFDKIIVLHGDKSWHSERIRE